MEKVTVKKLIKQLETIPEDKRDMPIMMWSRDGDIVNYAEVSDFFCIDDTCTPIFDKTEAMDFYPDLTQCIGMDKEIIKFDATGKAIANAFCIGRG